MRCALVLWQQGLHRSGGYCNFDGVMENISADIFHLFDNQPEPSRGSLLLAKPTVDDACFKRSVILVIDHDSDGSMGVIVNRPSGYTLADVIADADKDIEGLDDIPIYMGGPVGLNQMFFLHTLGPDIIPGCLQVGKELYFGGDYEAVKRYVACGEPTEGVIKFIVGYSGWEKGQLASEIARHDWAVKKSPDHDMLMAEMDYDMWNEAVNSFGDKYRIWNNWPSNPSDN